MVKNIFHIPLCRNLLIPPAVNFNDLPLSASGLIVLTSTVSQTNHIDHSSFYFVPETFAVGGANGDFHFWQFNVEQRILLTSMQLAS